MSLICLEEDEPIMWFQPKSMLLYLEPLRTIICPSKNAFLVINEHIPVWNG
ncbi:MAG: hypothetical protein ACTSP3_17360 [Candidatus Heimdallarchaeaceae archaeon]